MATGRSRRAFLTGALGGAAALGAASNVAALGATANGAAAQAAKPRQKARMKLGHQHHDSEADLKIMAALGVSHICSSLPSRTLDANWTVAGLSGLRERVEKHGVTLEAVPLPMSSVAIEKAEMPNILLGRDPERDREIDRICEMIGNAAKAGIFLLKYNLTLLGVPRTAATPGRGGARYSAFDYAKADFATPTIAGHVTADLYWERVTYFLKRVVPVAEANKVRLACHPNDPSMARKGFRDIQCPLGTVDGLKRFIEIAPSRFNGLNFCQGTVCEMLENPNREIVDVIRYFGSRGKIFNVHFRNIKGHVLDFAETLPDNGDVDMPRALRAYQEVGYDGMIMPDHVPVIEGDTGGALAYAYSFGYIQALLQTLQGTA
jgi:mannonate dehydratase